ncbi:unnamed protein product [Clonostachys byssicola]|uniref:Zn(2)-C6 fungal-type domain-containing protein n=1 Tax=Clonostachys byssicola TaxID=160290 RepID=A0A9N9UC79_9HYPO|nr:unnamed protein product [Clonostachys byssicola]
MAKLRGRSGACTTCLRRRKGCDQQRPACSQCRKACIACEGYPDRSSLSFVDATQTTIKRANTVHHHRAPRKKPTASPVRHAWAMASNDTLAVKATETGHVDLFWRQYLPNGREIPCDVAHSITGGWVHAVQSLYRSEDSVLRGILLALALATRGCWEDMPSARELGLRLYNDALAEASAVFQLPKRAKSNSFLAAVRLFTLYESHYGAQFNLEGPNSSSFGSLTQAENWLTHIKGDMSLMIARSPSSFIEGDAHRLFVDGRFHLIFSALAARKPTPLASPEWLTVPWTKHSKTSRDLLLDILASLTEIISETDDLGLCLTTDTPGVDDKLSSIASACQLIDKRLAAWELEFAPEAIRRLAIRSSDLDAHLSNATAPTLTFHELAATHLMTLFWATCLALAQVQQDFYNITREENTSRNGYLTDARPCFKNLMATLPILFEPAVGLYRMHVASAPTHIAVRHLHYLPDEVDRQEAQVILRKCLGAPGSKNLRVMVRSLLQKCPTDAKLISVVEGLG